MCFGGDGGAGEIAQQQRADEVARQQRIKDGMSSIAKVFEGSPHGVGAATSYDPSKTYYRADGSVYAPGNYSGYDYSFGGIPFEGPPGMLAHGGQLFEGTETTGGFNDAFYKKRADDYSAFATPELEKQAKAQHEQLIYALSRTGNLDSSAAIKRNADLNDEVNTQRINVANEGLNQSNALRSKVEGARSNVVAELNATGDSSAASAAALRNVQNLSQPEGYSPLGNLFASFAQGVSQIGSNASNGYGGFSGAGGRSSLFQTGKSSQRVVGG